MASIADNRARYEDPATWSHRGDSWTCHADFSGRPYREWKQSVVDALIAPYIAPGLDVLEIGAGQGRWSEFIIARSRTAILVDISAYCVETCRRRFGHRADVRYVVNDGRTLPVRSGSVDVVWAFGTFVHVDDADIDSYLAETSRVLRPGGRFVVHHAGWRDWSRHLVPAARRLGRPGRVVLRRFAQDRWRDGGGRSAMSAERFAALAIGHGLVVDRQFREWGAALQYNVNRYRDVITVGSSPAHAPARTSPRVT
jgi:SAM-dependent methyltransferase